MDQYLQIVRHIVPSLSKEQLVIPFKNAGIDSIDQLAIRVSIEKHYGFEVPDQTWHSFASLGEAFSYFSTNSTKPINTVEVNPIELERQHEIGMPLMANSALSESWLLKELGDIHWNLLAKGLEIKSSFLHDENGNRLYATFIRLSYKTAALNKFKENEVLEFKGSIERFGTNTYVSNLQMRSGDLVTNATLMSSFTQRELDDNRALSKSTPVNTKNTIPLLRNTPPFFDEYRLLKKKLIEQVNYAEFTFNVIDESLGEEIYEINPYYEINGVGLLYFASYPIIADVCLLKVLKENKLGKSHTIFRDIFYFANCNQLDKVVFRLNSIDESKGLLFYSCSLYRHSDNALMARIFTIKEL